MFDPDARVRDSGGGIALIPGDPGHTNPSILTSGAYIDMGVSGAGKFASINPKASWILQPTTHGATL